MENAGNVALDLAGPLSPSSDALLEAAQVGTWEVDIAGRCVRVSGAFLALLGRRPRAAVFRREWTRLLHPDDVPTALSARKDLIRGTSDRLSIDLRVRHSTRGFVWITAHGSVTALAPDGTPSRLGGIALALAETTSLGKRLEKQAAALRETTDGTAITDASGCYTFMNPMHRQMFGIPETADISMIHWSELYEPEVAARIVGTVMPDLQSAGSWRGELRGRRLDDGRPVPQEVSLTLGSDGGIICATRDIAERLRDQRDRLRLREEMIATQRQEVVHLLTAGVAHDLMNMLGLIQQHAGLIETGDRTDALQGAQAITATVQQATALVRERLAVGQAQATARRTDLRRPFRRAAELLRASLPDTVDFAVTLPDRPLEMTASETDVLQVALNLLLNATDAIDPAAGRIRLDAGLATVDEAAKLRVGTLTEGTTYVRLSVADNGTGLSADTASEVFRPYVSSKGAGGTGLGLFVVAEIARKHEGGVDLDSAPGQGTRVTVYLRID